MLTPTFFREGWSWEGCSVRTAPPSATPWAPEVQRARPSPGSSQNCGEADAQVGPNG